MKRGDVILAELPISERHYKKRPALVMSVFPPYNDFFVCGISSQLKQFREETGLLLLKESDAFINTGLIRSSLIRLNYVALIPKEYVLGRIGIVPKDLYNDALTKFIELIKR